MNERILLEEGVIQESLGAADGGLAKPRSLDELRARIYVLFRHIDQQAGQHPSMHAVNRAGRGQVTQWPQREMVSNPI
jgi:hypothetical protein